MSQEQPEAPRQGSSGSGVVDEHESRERGEDERKRFRGRSVEKRGVIEERGGEIGDAGMAAILRV